MGLSPEAIALVFALGLVLGVFPVFGLPTVLCTLAALVFRINLPAIQLVNQVSSPLQYALLIPLGRLGARIVSAGEATTPVSVNSAMVWGIVHSARNAVVGWCCFCIPAGLVLYLIVAYTVRRCRRPCFNELGSAAW